MLAFLRRWGIQARMQEPPDLAFTLSGSLGDYGFACKKVYGDDSVGSQLRTGCRQLRAMGSAGLVAFNLDDITPARSVLVQPTRQTAGDALQSLNIQCMQRHRLESQEAG